MRKLKLFILLIFAAGFLFSACKKQSDKTVPPQELQDKTATSSIPRCPPDQNPVDFYSQLFTDDETFALVVDKFGNNSFDVVKAIYEQGGKEAVQEYEKLVAGVSSYEPVQAFYEERGLDAELMLDKKAETLASLLLLYKNHPDFYAMEVNDQTLVIANVIKTLSDANFRAAHPKSPGVLMYTALAERVGAEISNPLYRLTMEEVGDCLQEAVIGGIVNSIGVIRDLYNVITGYNLGWSGIVRVAKSALSSVLHSSFIGAAVGFGLCIAWETFF